MKYQSYFTPTSLDIQLVKNVDRHWSDSSLAKLDKIVSFSLYIWSQLILETVKFFNSWILKKKNKNKFWEILLYQYYFLLHVHYINWYNFHNPIFLSHFINIFFKKFKNSNKITKQFKKYIFDMFVSFLAILISFQNNSKNKKFIFNNIQL